MKKKLAHFNPSFLKIGPTKKKKKKDDTGFPGKCFKNIDFDMRIMEKSFLKKTEVVLGGSLGTDWVTTGQALVMVS